jgi:hypothetical protein
VSFQKTNFITISSIRLPSDTNALKQKGNAVLFIDYGRFSQIWEHERVAPKEKLNWRS